MEVFEGSDLKNCAVIRIIKKGNIRLTGLTGLSEFVAQADAEIAGNAMLCVVNQAAYLLRRQVEQLGRDFVEHGGFTERL